MAALVALIIFFLPFPRHDQSKSLSCDTIHNGYTCAPNISRLWGQYSPYFSVPSEISSDLPDQCRITFAQILSRHGARDPTTSKSALYTRLIQDIHANATSYSVPYTFLKGFKYQLGANQLSLFGQQQMVNSGIKYYHRYKSIGRDITPVVRASGQERVVQSALNWTQGFHIARIRDAQGTKDPTYPYRVMTLSEDPGTNNTLNHGLCSDFENGPPSRIAKSAKSKWASIFVPKISARLNSNLPGTNFSLQDTIHMMDLCPFLTVADKDGAISPFCALFSEDEWRAYDYYQSLNKYYGFSWGNPLGPTQGVGFTNELIARLTNTPVDDNTSTNFTLDTDPDTFPIGGNTILYADFSHDNDMISIFSAMGLFNSTAPLSNTSMESPIQTKGYSASWDVSFAARAYIEKMHCGAEDEEFVRVLINDRVLPLETCGGDSLGRCKLRKFIDSLSFARSGGLWNDC